MQFKIKWLKPISLLDGSKDFLIYTCDLNDMKHIPTSAGVYMFACRNTKNGHLKPLYIGESKNLRSRIDSHFKGSTRLMNQIRKKKGTWRKDLTNRRFTARVRIPAIQKIT